MVQNIIAITIVALVIGYAVYKMLKKPKKGRGGCGTGCGCSS